MGANCRHSFYPVIDGISEPLYTEEELANIDRPPFEYDGKEYTEYEATQRQRYMERAIRKTKRELLAAENTNDKEQFTAKSVLLRRQKEEYNKFCKAAGLLTENERTQLAGFGRSQASKAVWSGKKASKNAIPTTLTNQSKQGIIKCKSSLRKCKNFEEMKNYLSSNYSIEIESTVETMNYRAVKKSVTGIELVIKEFPQLKGAIISLGTANDGVMCAGYNGKICFNPLYYNDLKNAQKASISFTGFHPKRNNIISTGAHEAGHIIERLLIHKSVGTNSVGITLWNDCTYAKNIVHKACQNIKSSMPKGSKQSFNEIRKSVSRYALTNDSECLAECVADYIRNRRRASPLSIEVVKLIKEELKK